MGVGVLGPLAVGGTSNVLRRHDRVVLAALVVQLGEAVSAGRLADALWGTDPPETWGKVVQGCVVRLRKVLGPGAIETTPQGYRLSLLGDEVDARRFERLVIRARELLGLGEPERASYAADEALALWRGPPFPELEGWDVGRAEIARLTELHHEAEELRVDAALRVGRGREVLAQAQTLVAVAPLRERRWALLALAQYQAGQQAAALQTLRQVRAVLAAELAIDPGPELVALEQAVLCQDPALVSGGGFPEPSPECPYRGLVPYGVGDGEAFFGRGEEADECLRRLADHGVLAVVGPSGSGKSSLVRAGVAAALQRDGRRVVVMTPGALPMDALSVLPEAGPLPVLVVDQCEEALTGGGDTAAGFLEALALHAARGALVVALRADRIGELSSYPAFARLVERGLFLLGPMGPDELRACVEGPARQAGLLVEPGLVDLLVREVEGEPGALPLLSHALRATWLHREGRTLTVAGYRASGGIRGAVARSAEDVYERVPEEHRPIVRDLLLRLVSWSEDGPPLRSQLPRRLVTDDTAHREVVDRLIAARLVISDAGVLELAHEALVRAWPRYRQWLEEDRQGQRLLRHLSATADAWDSMGRPDSELYRGGRLAQALDWQRTSHPRLAAVESDFLDASRRQDEAELREAKRHAHIERQARRRTRRLAAALAVALSLAVVAAAGATWFQMEASDRAAQAAAASTDADANRLAALSNSVPSLDLSLLLAVQALRTADTPATRAGLLKSLVAHRRATQVTQLHRRAYDALLADNGKTLFVNMPTEIDAWRVGSTRSPQRVVRWGHKYDFIGASPTRGLVAAWAWKDFQTPRVAIFDSHGHRRFLIRGFEDIHTYPKGLGFSPDGRRLLVSVLDGADPSVRRTRIDTYDIASGRRLDSTPLLHTARPGAWPTADVDDSGTTAISWIQGAAGPAVLLDLRTGHLSPVAVADRHQESPGFIPLPTGAAQTWADGTITLYDRNGRQSQVLQAHHDLVNDVVVSMTGAWAATGDESGNVITWNIDPHTGQWSPRDVLGGHNGSVVALTADPRGKELVSVSDDGTAITWDMTPRGGFGSSVQGLRDRWMSNRPAVVVPGRLIVAPTRAAPGLRVGWWQQTKVSATFIDPRSGRTVATVPAGDNGGFVFGSSAAVSPDRSRVAVTYGYGTVVLDARTRRVLARIALPDIKTYEERRPEPVWCSAWTPDGKRLLLCADGGEYKAEDGNLVVVDTDTWEPRRDRVDIGGAAQTLEVSPDGRILAVGMIIPDVDNSPPGTVRILDAHTLQPIRDLHMGKEDFPYDLSFSPDGTKLAVGVSTGLVYVFDVATGRRLHDPARVQSDFVQQVEWLPDSRTVVTTGSDSTVSLYDAKHGLVRATMPASDQGGKAYTYLLSVSAHHVSVIAGQHAGKTYPLDPQRWIDDACAVVRRDLTRDEWASYLPDRPYRRTCTGRP